MLKTNERIITSEDLAQAVDVALTNVQQEPVVITENGRPAAYLISIELFDALTAQLEAQEALELATNITVAEDQFAQGKFKTLEQAQALAEAKWSEQE